MYYNIHIIYIIYVCVCVCECVCKCNFTLLLSELYVLSFLT